MNKVDKGEIVEEYLIGNTKVLISNNAYKNKTEEEINRVISKIENTIGDIYGVKCTIFKEGNKNR